MEITCVVALVILTLQFSHATPKLSCRRKCNVNFDMCLSSPAVDEGLTLFMNCAQVKVTCSKECLDPNQKCWKKCKKTVDLCFQQSKKIKIVTKCVNRESRRCARKCVKKAVNI